MKTNLHHLSRLLNLGLSASLATLLLSSCSKENIEPSNASAATSATAMKKSSQNFFETTEEMKASKTSEALQADAVLLSIEEVAPIGQPAFTLEFLSTGKVRFNGKHDVTTASAEILIQKNYMLEIRELLGQLKQQDAAALRLASASGTNFATTLVTLPSAEKPSMCFRGDAADSKISGQILELKKAIFKAADIDGLLQGEIKN